MNLSDLNATIVLVLLRLIMRYLKPYWPWVTAIVILQFGSALASLYLPRLNADIVDKGLAQGDVPTIKTLGVEMLVISGLQVAMAFGAIFLSAMVAMRVGRDLRSDVFRKVTSFSQREVAGFGAGSLITRNTNDIQQIQMLTMVGMTMLLTAPLLGGGGIVMAVSQEPKMSWILGVAVPVMLVVSGFIILRMVPLFRRYQVKIDTLNRIMREQLTGIRVVRAFVREKLEAKRFRGANDDLLDIGKRVGSLFVLLFPLVFLILDLTIVAVIWVGGHEVDKGNVEIGTLMAFMTYVMLILVGVLMASFTAMMVPRAAVSAERVAEVLDSETTLVRGEANETEFSEPGTVEFRDVSFAYPGADKAVVDQVSFKAPRGKTLAIVGSTGSGKTTLVSLIPRLFDVTDGAVLVGGVDVREADVDAVWSTIGIVPQKPYLFTGSIAYNLRFGREDATDDELWRALEIAQAKDFVEKMDGQLDARISQGGTNVSGGQRQRLAIARAIVKGPEILIFDDSFSALDLATDARLRKALWAHIPDVTKIVVAQRISTIVDADQIVVLEDGAVVGVGTHDELLQTCGTYQEIVESQRAVEAK